MPAQLEQSAQDGLLLCLTLNNPGGSARVTSGDRTGRRPLQYSPLRHAGSSFPLLPGSAPLPRFCALLFGDPGVFILSQWVQSSFKG